MQNIFILYCGALDEQNYKNVSMHCIHCFSFSMMWLVSCISYVNAAAPLSVADASGTNEGLKGREPHHITLTPSKTVIRKPCVILAKQYGNHNTNTIKIH